MMGNAEADAAARPRDLRTNFSEGHIFTLKAWIDLGKRCLSGDLLPDNRREIVERMPHVHVERVTAACPGGA
jgi:hypothetical protein